MASPWDINNFGNVPAPYRQNRYGERFNVDPTQPLGEGIPGYLTQNPASWITAGLAGTGMRAGDTGRHRQTFENYLGPGMQLFYEMANPQDAQNQGAVQWMHDFAQNWLVPGGDAGLSTEGALDFIGNVFNNRQDYVPFQSDLYDFDADPRNLINLITTAAFQGLSPTRVDRLQREMARKLDDWTRFVDQTGEEIPYIDYLQSSGLLGNWDIPGF